MDDRPSLQTCQASVTQGTSADVNISDVKESSEHQAVSIFSFVVMICVLFRNFILLVTLINRFLKLSLYHFGSKYQTEIFCNYIVQ